MKRVLTMVLVAALACRAAVGFAEGAGTGTDDDREDSFAPFQVGLAPGIALPRGRGEAAVSVGLLGSGTESISGFQGGGIFSVAKDVRGIQGAGLLGVVREDLRGIQGTGFVGVAGDVQGLQGAGAVAVAQDVEGAQVSGLFSVGRDVRGYQGSQILNVARDVRGVQASGALNVAGEVRGIQLGLVNVAKSVDGAQIGLVNYAADGIHSLGVAWEPATSYLYAYWQSGVPRLYTRWSVGAPADEGGGNFSGTVASFGVGSRRSIAVLDIDADLAIESSVGRLSPGRVEASEDRGDDHGRRYSPGSIPRPYPSLRAEASLPIAGVIRAFGGVKADIDIGALGDRVPESLKAGWCWKGSAWGGDFAVWPKLFLGLKI